MRLYRARWQVELLFKRLKQLLRAHTIRAATRAAAEATVRALLVAWALQERLAATVRAEVAAVAPADPARPVSLWRVAEVSLRTLAQAVRGSWTVAHLRGLSAPAGALPARHAPAASAASGHGARLAGRPPRPGRSSRRRSPPDAALPTRSA